MANRCDVPGCEQEARLFAPTRRRCLAHADGQAPSLRSDVPMKEPHRHERPCANPFCAVCYPAAPRPWPIGEPDVAALCPECGRSFADGLVKCLHLGHHTPRAPAPLPVGEAERRVWRTRVRVALHREIDARHAAARAEARTAEVERILTNWPADGAYALRVLRGETR